MGRVIASLAAFVALFVSGCIEAEPAPITITDRHEIIARRLYERQPIRDVSPCIGEPFLHLGAYSVTVIVDLTIDRSGNAKLESLESDEDLVFQHADDPACIESFRRAMASWHYRPFTSGGRSTSARIREFVDVLPPIRMRANPPDFPNAPIDASTRVILERYEGLFYCPAQPSYRLELRGDGTALYTERVRGQQQGGPLYVDAESRRYAIDPTAFADLIERFKSASFFSFEAEYNSGASDVAVQRLTLEIGGQTASVLDAKGEEAGMPPSMGALEAQVDQVGQLPPWTCVGVRF